MIPWTLLKKNKKDEDIYKIHVGLSKECMLDLADVWAYGVVK